VPEHYLHRPGDSVAVKFRAIDANDKPVQTTGTVRVVRRRWKDRQYGDEEILTPKLSTDANGEATLRFTPKSAGYYQVVWTSTDTPGSTRARDVVTAETTVWVADRTTTDIGYYYAGGMQLIVDKEALRVGETASVMLVAPESGRWAFVTSSADSILESQVVKLDGTVKLLQIPIDDRHVPNFFLTASSVFKRQLSTATERIVVPPVEHFLTVDVKADREQYEPRQEGTLTITTRDASGNPVPAEVAVSVSDEAVTAIQQDPAGDPRQFFYGELRENRLRVDAGLHHQRYLDLDDEQERERKEEDRYGRLAEGGVVGGVVGGMADAAVALESIATTAQRRDMAPPPPPPMAPPVPSPVANEAAPAAAGIDVQVRTDFRSTAFWKPDVVTDANGLATLTIKYPEALTTWRATARAATSGSAFGMGSSTARTNLPLLVRLQAPRFFVAGDRAVVSAVINNNTDEAIDVTATLEAEGLEVERRALSPSTVPPHADARVDWNVSATKAGNAKLRVTARGGRYGDAMEKPFLVWEHGIDKLIARSGKLRGDEAVVRLELPRERRATELVIYVKPSLAAAML
ncbi:MAG: alpha-2-macroglobulin family protein, partial [Thermoanaerobaculia bacterium]